LKIQLNGIRAASDQRSDRSHRDPGKEETECATHERQQHALGEELPDEPEPTGTDRHPNRHFFRPRSSASHQQVRNVGAPDQQHHAYHSHQHSQ
jgi:hypothetical protein